MPRARKVPAGGTAAPPPPAPAPAPAGRWLAQFLLPLAAGGALLAAVLVLGEHALHRLTVQGRYQVRFADVDCPAPPGLSRQEFLGQVQYLADLPDRLDRLDPRLGERLHAAFAAHL